MGTGSTMGNSIESSSSFFHRRKGFLQDSLCLSRLYTATGVTDKKCSQCKSASIHLQHHHCSETLRVSRALIFIQICEIKPINYVANRDPLLSRIFKFGKKDQHRNKTCTKLINHRCIWLSNTFFPQI